jgi:hypothetical protein
MTTPGQRAYDVMHRASGVDVPHEDLGDDDKRLWDDIAQAVLNDAFPGLKRNLAQARRELAEARASGIRLMGLIEMYVRSLYAVRIDVMRGDSKAVMEALSEGLDGFDGSEWNRMETGAEWLERTRAEGPS